MPKHTTFAIVISAFLGACGGGAEKNGNTGSRDQYPAGPYGTTESSIIAPLGFVEPSGTQMTLAEIHANSEKQLLLMSTTSGWCTACVEEQPALESLHDRYAAKGLSVLVAIFEDADFNPADASRAELWKRQYELTFDVVADPDFQLGQYYKRDLTPMNMIVEVPSMKILRIATGWDPNAVEAIVSARLD